MAPLAINASLALHSASAFQLSLPDDPISSRTSYLTTTTTSLTACITLMISLSYLVVLSWVHKYAQTHPRPLNKASGVHLQKYAPFVYVFLVFASLAEVALASWLILQYRFNHNYPTVETRTGARLILFSACWTTLTAGTYSILFIHPTWSKYPVSSVGAQAIWVFLTWILWIVGAGIVNKAVPGLLIKGACAGVAYCGQIRALFGISVLQSLSLTGGMITMMWLAWQSTRATLAPNGFLMLARSQTHEHASHRSFRLPSLSSH